MACIWYETQFARWCCFYCIIMQAFFSLCMALIYLFYCIIQIRQRTIFVPLNAWHVPVWGRGFRWICEACVAVSVSDSMLMFNNGCVRTRLVLRWDQLFSRPDSALVCRFSQPLPPLPCLTFCWRLRNGDVDSVSQKSSKYKLSYPGPRGAVIIFPLRSPIEPLPAALIWVPTRVYVKPPDRLQKLLISFSPSLCSFLSFVVCGTCFSFVFHHCENVRTSFTRALAVFVLCLTRSCFQNRSREKPAAFARRVTLSHDQNAFRRTILSVNFCVNVSSLNCKSFWTSLLLEANNWGVTGKL